ncbi:unnamed protein product [Symbiodinium sp. CCMP2592]|nr:unnamed protein product [Symbiodinium sp. CCMP2592]
MSPSSTDMRQYKLFPTYFGFYILDFSGNNITELAGRPKGDCSYDLSRNPLSRISEMYFAWPSSLNIRESGFDSEAEGSIQGPDGPRKWEDVFEISNQSVRAVRNNGEGWECEWVNSRENPFFDLWISPKTFAPRHLCTCLENFEDDGTACRKCPTGVTSIPDGDTSTSRSRCCACPEGKTAVGDSNMCYKCLGPGCTHRVCTGRCPKGYGGALCSYCADKYKRDFGSKVCEKCPRDGRFGGWTYAKYIGICGLWFAGLGGVLWYFVYHKVERFSGNELGQRKQECIEQSLLLLTFFQLLKTVRYAVDTKSAAGAKMSFFGYSFDILRTAVLLRIGDLLKLLDVECDVGHLNGLLIQRLSSALLLPTLCLLALAVGGCRGSPFFALRFCLFVVALLFPGTIEVTLSNLICVTADEEGLPLPEKDRFNQELPWVPCDSPAGFLYALLWIAFVLNAIILPLSILILARYMHREVEPLWLWSRWLKPSNLSSSPDGFTLRWDVPAVALVARSASGPAQGSAEQYTRMLQKSSQIFLAAHAAFLWESMRHPQQLAIRTSFLNAGLPHADAAQQNAMASHSPAADAHPLQQALLSL